MILPFDQIRDVAARAGFPDPNLMAAIAMAESGGDTNAVNDTRGLTDDQIRAKFGLPLLLQLMDAGWPCRDLAKTAEVLERERAYISALARSPRVEREAREGAAGLGEPEAEVPRRLPGLSSERSRQEPVTLSSASQRRSASRRRRVDRVHRIRERVEDADVRDASVPVHDEVAVR